MKTWSEHNATKSKVLVIGLFVLSSLLIVSLFPRQLKFRYEYGKGKPWLHNNLIAPFDFAINKLPEEIGHERDSLLKTLSPYFNWEADVEQGPVAQIEADLYKRFTKAMDTLQVPDTLYFPFISMVSHKLGLVYKTGILPPLDLIDEVFGKDSAMTVIRANVAESYRYSDFYTLKSAYQTIQAATDSLVNDTLLQPQIRALANQVFGLVDFEVYIQANLRYNSELSEKARKEMIDNISLSSGMVQKGEAIIMRGEVVDAVKFKVLESIRQEYGLRMSSSANAYLILLGRFLLVSVCLLSFFLFLANFRREILNDLKSLSFIFLQIIVFVLLASLSNQSNFIYLVPFAVVPIIIKTFFDSRVAMFVHLTLMLIVGFLVPNSFDFVFQQLMAGIIAVFSLNQLIKRKQLFITSGIVFLVHSTIYFAIGIIEEGDVSRIELEKFAWYAGNSLLLMIWYPLALIFEWSYGYLSDVTLMELNDTNQPLLRMLSEKAPGTFQHSLQVANLAEEAIYQIHGNPLLVRVGAMYHDIGKSLTPQYFTENQVGYNPHDELPTLKSAQIILNHISKGAELARKHKLPKQIVDFIWTHQGTTSTRYFLTMFKRDNPDVEPDMNNFTYPGPKPFSKETAVVMMADSVEAASKSLRQFDAASINKLVDKIIDGQLSEGQFSEANITFKHISQIKECFKRKLLNIYHSRIEYPEN